ncbi:MAG: NAD(P)-dependent oxidoreductase [Myxococcota bacterium]
MSNIAFIGLGAMGQRMAKRLLDAGHTLTVYNRTRSRARDLVDAGATLAGSPREAAQGKDVVVTMVTDDEAARAVWLHPETGALAGMCDGAVAIESSTVTPMFVQELQAAVHAAGKRLLDAPVAGSRPQAEAGALIYLVGGDAGTLDEVRPLLDVMGGAIHHCGSVGHGAALKLMVNAIFGLQIATLSELLGTASAVGMDVAHAVGILNQLPVTSQALKGIGGLIAKGMYAPMFPIDLVEKDIRYAALLAAEHDKEAPMVRAGRGVYQDAKSAGFGADNIHAVAKLYLEPKP